MAIVANKPLRRGDAASVSLIQDEAVNKFLCDPVKADKHGDDRRCHQHKRGKSNGSELLPHGLFDDITT